MLYSSNSQFLDGQGGLNLLLQGFDIIAGLVEFGAGQLQGGHKGARIDLKEELPCLDKLIIRDWELDYGGCDSWSDLNDLGAHLSIPGPRIGDIVPILGQEHTNSKQEHNTREQ